MASRLVLAATAAAVAAHNNERPTGGERSARSYLLTSYFHRQAFASAARHQLLAFLQVAAFTNRTAVLPFARVGEPAFAGLPQAGYQALDRYFDVGALKRRWPCLRVVTYDAFKREAPSIGVTALQLGLPPGAPVSANVVEANCGRRSRPLMSLRATFACGSRGAAASAGSTLGARWRGRAVIVTNWSQKIVGLGDGSSPLFGDAFAARGGCHDAAVSPSPRAFPPLASRWREGAAAFVAAPPLNGNPFVCAHVRAEKLASAASGPAKRKQWVRQGDEWVSPYMENCATAAMKILSKRRRGRPVLLLTDADDGHGTPSNQGSTRFREWRRRGETLIRSLAPGAAKYCGGFGASEPECALHEAAACRMSDEVFRFGSGTFSEFVVGDDRDRPKSTQWLDCSEIKAAAG